MDEKIGVLDVFLGGVGGEWVGAWIRVCRGGVVLCLCEMWVWIICVNDRSRYLCIVLGGYLRILVVFVYSRYRKPIIVCVMLSDLDLSRHHPLL